MVINNGYNNAMMTTITNLPCGVSQTDLDTAAGAFEPEAPSFDQIADELPDAADAACLEAMDGLDLVTSLLALADASDAVKRSKTIAELRSADLLLAARAANIGREARRIAAAVVEKLQARYRDRVA